MEKSNKFKLFIGLVYLILICLFLYFFFSKFSFHELTSYDFIRKNKSYFFELKNSNLILIFFIFLVLSILWVFPLLGFGSPVALLGGFIFGKWIGTIVVVLGVSIGGTFLYMFGNYFFKDVIREKFLNKYYKLEIKFKKSEFLYMLIYRLIGGVPWQISCLLSAEIWDRTFKRGCQKYGLLGTIGYSASSWSQYRFTSTAKLNLFLTSRLIAGIRNWLSHNYLRRSYILQCGIFHCKNLGPLTRKPHRWDKSHGANRWIQPKST